MKVLICSCICILTVAVLFNILPIHGEEMLYDDTIRLHVKAASDTEEDQALKLKVRDSVLEVLSKHLNSVNDTQIAEKIIAENLSQIEAAANTAVEESGLMCDVSVSFEREKYPERQYDNFTLPAGEYRSLRVTLGNGKGHNWWCILFPTVCLSQSSDAEDKYTEAGFTPEQYRIIDNNSSRKYKVRFKILELLAEMFS